jgi:hypothetical protein
MSRKFGCDAMSGELKVRKRRKSRFIHSWSSFPRAAIAAGLGELGAELLHYIGMLGGNVCRLSDVFS